MLSQPSEPHLTRYFVDHKGFLPGVVNNEIYPVWTYAYLPLLLLAAPLAEAWGYRRVILLGTSFRVATRILLLFGSSKAVMQLMEALYAGGSVAEIVLAAYVFRVVKQDRYEDGVAATQSAYFVSHVISGIMGDVMTQAFGWSLVSTFWVSLGTVSAAAAVAILLLPHDRDQATEASTWVDPERSVRDTGAAAATSCVTNARFVGRAVASPRYGAAALLWCGGNCAWLFVYGWETSIYEVWQPHGSDWNGSVLGLGLVVAAGATALITWRPLRAAVLASPFVVVALASTCAVAAAFATALAPWPWGLMALLAYMFAWQLTNAAFLAASAHRVDAVMLEDAALSKAALGTAAERPRDWLAAAAAADDGDGAGVSLLDRGKAGSPASPSAVAPAEGASAMPAGSPPPEAAGPAESPYSLLLLLLNSASLLLQTGLQAWWLSAMQVDVPTLFLYSSVMFAAFLGSAAAVRAGSVLCSCRGS